MGKMIQFFKAICLCLIPSFFYAQERESSSFAILGPPTNHPLRECNTLLGEVVVSCPRTSFKCTWFPYLEENWLTNGIWFEIQTQEFSSMTVEESEKIYAELAEYYLGKLNQLKIIRPYLREFPLDARALTMCLGFNKKNKGPLDPPNITGIMLDRNQRFEYLQFRERGEFGAYTRVLKKDLYSMSLLKHLQAVSVPRTKEREKPVVPEVPFSDPKKCAPIGLVTRDCVIRVTGKYGLKRLVSGPEEGNGPGERQYSVGFILWGRQKLKFEEARSIAAGVARDTLAVFRSEKHRRVVEGYLDECNLHFREHNGKTAEPHHFSFRISFWDEDVNRPEAPYISEVRYLKGRFHYYTADEGQRLVPVFEESFDDALRFLGSGLTF